MELTPVTKTEKEGEVEDVFFDLMLIVDKENNLQVIDRQKNDWHDYVDCNTLIAQEVKLRP